jgi:hypothetical protein
LLPPSNDTRRLPLLLRWRRRRLILRIRRRSALGARRRAALHHLLLLCAFVWMPLTPMWAVRPGRWACHGVATWRWTVIAGRWTGFRAAGWWRSAFFSGGGTIARSRRRRAISAVGRRRAVARTIRSIGIIGAGGKQYGRSDDRRGSKPMTHECPHLAEIPSDVSTPRRLFGGNWIG